MNALIRFLQWAVLNHPKKIVLLHVLFVIGAGVLGATQLQIEGSVDGLMDQSDPDYQSMKDAQIEFSNDEVIVVAVELGHVFTKEDLVRLARLGERLEQVPSVRGVVSLANIEDVRGDGAGGLDASPLLGPERLAALDDAGLEALRKRVATHPLYPRKFVSKELDVLAMVVELDPPDAGKRNIGTATDAIYKIVEADMKGWAPYWLTGYPILEREGEVLLMEDIATLTPFVFLTLLLVFYGVARRLFSVILISALGLWTSAVAVVYFALSGTPINLVTSAVPPILLATSSVYGIFLLGFLQTRRDIVHPAMTVIAVATRPSFVAMFSTAMGFLSMLFIQVDALRDMGIGLAVGTAGCFVAELLLLPALIQLVDFKAPPVKWKWVERFATCGVGFARHPWRVIMGVVLLIVVCIPGLAQLRVDTNVLDYYPEDGLALRSDAAVRDKLGRGVYVTYVVRTDRPDGALTPEVAKLVEALCTEAKKGDVVDDTLSLLDYNAMMDRALRPETPPQRVLPSAELASQYLLLYEMGGDRRDLAPYINNDRSALALRLRIYDVTSNSGLDLERRLQAVSAAHPEARATVRALSSSHMIVKSADSITTGVIPGFAMELLVVFFVFWLTLRSWKLALIAIPPNILPSIFCMAALGFADIPISIGSSLVGFISVGLAIDDTAHILAHVKEGDHSMRRVYSEVGMPVLLTSVALGLGFLVLAFSRCQVIAVFGIATGITLSTAVLGDIVMLPSILKLLGYRMEDAHDTVTPTDDEDRPLLIESTGDAA